ncbi:hypothetical protein VPHK567_0389 [Vibrio phage K567]
MLCDVFISLAHDNFLLLPLRGIEPRQTQHLVSPIRVSK